MRGGVRLHGLPGRRRLPGGGGRLRAPGAGPVQRPRRGAGPRPRRRAGGLGRRRSGIRCGTPARTSTTPCGRSRRCSQQAAADLRVATGMLDARHLAGDPNLTLRLRSAVLTQWRRDARTRLEEMHGLVSERGRLTGELAHASVPDLKESVGGLRDATMLKALVASWLVDVPHGDLERCRVALLDVRDALHAVAGRATDRVAPEYWDEIAHLLGLPDAGGGAGAHPRARPAADPPLAPGLAARGGGAAPAQPDRRTTPAARDDRPRGRDLLRGGRAGPGREAGRGHRCCSCVPRPRRRSATWCWPRRRRRGWPARPRRCPSRGRSRRTGPVRAAAGGRSRTARRLGDPRRDRRPGADPAGVGAGPAAAARLGRAPLHRGPAPGRDLHRGLVR